jgi:flagellar biosynthetic protein FliR
MLVATGGLNSFIGAFYHSYEVLPVGMSNIIGNAPFAMMTLTLLTEFIVIAVKIAMPIIGVIVVINVALGIMVKTVPQMNVFVVGMPIKLLVGLFLLASVMSPTLGWIYDKVFDTAYDALISTIWGMAQP